MGLLGPIVPGYLPWYARKCGALRKLWYAALRICLDSIVALIHRRCDEPCPVGGAIAMKACDGRGNGYGCECPHFAVLFRSLC